MMKMNMNVNISMKMNMNYSVYDSRDNKMTMQISFAAVGIDSSCCKWNASRITKMVNFGSLAH